MVAATTVTVASIGSGDNEIAATDLQSALGTIYGKSVDASDTAYAAKGTLDGYVTPLVGKLDSEMSQVFTELGLTRAS